MNIAKMPSLLSLFKSSRQIATSSVRRAHGHGYAGAGSNLPFDLTNRFKLSLYFMLYFGSAFSMPFIMVRHHLTK